MQAQDIEEITQAFLNGDCWVLALEMAQRYEGLEARVIAGEGLEWIHMLVEDTHTGHFIDVNGVQTFDELQANWENYFWTGIIPAVPEHIEGMTRDHHVDPQLGIDLIKELYDWEEPAPRS